MALLPLSSLCALILYLSALDWMIARDAAEFAFVGGLVGADGSLVRGLLIVIMAIFLLGASLTWPALMPSACEYAPLTDTAHGDDSGKRPRNGSRPKPSDARPQGSNTTGPINEGHDRPGTQHAEGIRPSRDRSFIWTVCFSVAVVALLHNPPAFTSGPPKISTSDCAVLRSQQTLPDSAPSRPAAASEQPAKADVPTTAPNRSAAPREGPKDGRRGAPRPPP
jgi:hypothetical protein